VSAVEKTKPNGHDARHSDLVRKIGAAMQRSEYPQALTAVQQLIDLSGNNDNADRKATNVADVFDAWRTEGSLIHEPTGLAQLDEYTGGGPVYGSRWYLSGAPDAGKTALLVMIAHVFLERGITVGLLAVDEEAGDMVTRLAQRMGYSRQHCETRDPGVLDNMMDSFGSLPVRFYDDRWTIESAAADIAAFARQRAEADPAAHPQGPRAMLGLDSVQTIACDAERAAEATGRPMSTNEAVTARTRAIRASATKHRLIEIATSELNRSTYSSGDPDKQTSTLAGGKWSGSIEYSARVLLGLRSVPGESDLLDLEIAKNKHGPRDKHIYLRIDRRSQTLTETTYEPPVPEDPSIKRGERKRARVDADAEIVMALVTTQPGIGTRDLISAADVQGLSRGRVYAAMSKLGDRVERRDGKRDAKHHYPKGAA
jgi:replicative DNA helicase